MRAVLRDGTEVTLAARHGSTPDDLVASLVADTLTGSAVPLDSAKVTTADGGEVAYGDVNALIVDAA